MFKFIKRFNFKLFLIVIAFIGITFLICKSIEASKKISNENSVKDIFVNDSMRAVWV